MNTDKIAYRGYHYPPENIRQLATEEYFHTLLDEGNQGGIAGVAQRYGVVAV